MKRFVSNVLAFATPCIVLAVGCTRAKSGDAGQAAPQTPSAATQQIASRSLKPAPRKVLASRTTQYRAKVNAATRLAEFSGSQLRPASHEYVRRIHILGKAIEGTVTTAISKGFRDGRPVWQLTEESDDRLGGEKDSTVIDGQSLYPISRVLTASGAAVELAFSDKRVSGRIRTGATTLPVDVTLEVPIMTSGTPIHVALATLPLTEGYTTSAILLNPATAGVRPYLVKVETTERVTVPAGSFDAFRVKIQPSDGSRGHTTLWIEGANKRRLLKTEIVRPRSDPKWQKRVVSELVR